MALLGAMFALAVIGALVAGSFFAGRLEQQSGQNVLFAVQAREAAESGLAAAVLDPAALDSLPAGGLPLDLGVAPVGEAATVHTTVSRLTGNVFLLRARGLRHDAAGGPLATRTLGLFAPARRRGGGHRRKNSASAGRPGGGASLGGAQLSTATCCTSALGAYCCIPRDGLRKRRCRGVGGEEDGVSCRVKLLPCKGLPMCNLCGTSVAH